MEGSAVQMEQSKLFVNDPNSLGPTQVTIYGCLSVILVSTRKKNKAPKKPGLYKDESTEHKGSSPPLMYPASDHKAIINLRVCLSSLVKELLP